MKPKSVRAKFEKWASDNGMNLFREYGEYYYPRTYGAWLLWKSLSRKGVDPASVLL